MMDRELFRQALEALEQYTDVVTSVNDPNSWITVADGGKPAREAITALRSRLAQPNDFNPDWDAMAVMVEEQQRMAKRIAELEAQPEQEPVAWVDPSWMNPETRTWESESFAPGPINGWSPLYTAPPQRKPLTPDQVFAIADQHPVEGFDPEIMAFARAIEAAHGIKE